MQINKDEIRKALEAATPGPWEAIEMGMPNGAVWRVDIANRFNRNIATAMSKDNAILTANAPEWLRTLLASDDAKDETIRQQAAEIERMKQRLLMPIGVYEGYEQLRDENAQQAAEIERLTRMVSNAMKECADVVKATQEAEEARKAAEAEIERLKEFIETRTAQWMAALEREQGLQSALHESEEARKAAERERDELRKSRGEWLRMSFELGKCNAALRECLAKYADERRYQQSWYGKANEYTEPARTLLAELDRKDTQPHDDPEADAGWRYDNSAPKNIPPCPKCAGTLEWTRHQDYYCDACRESFGAWGDGTLIEEDKQPEGGEKPFFTGYRPQFYFRTKEPSGKIILPEVEDTQPVMGGIACVQCGESVADDDAFCKSCGANLDEDTQGEGGR